MIEYLWPWQSDVLREYPWVLLLFFAIMSFPLSLLSWIRWNKKSSVGDKTNGQG